MSWRLKYFLRYICPPLFKGYMLLKSIFSSAKRQEREKLFHEYGNFDDKEVKEVLAYIKKNNVLDMYNYDFGKKYLFRRDEKIGYDSIRKMYYVLHLCDDGVRRKLYFAEHINNPYAVRGIYNCLLLENDIQSPHRYINEFCTIPTGGCLADVGAQEGLLGLNNIELVERLYLFECDKNWIRALEATFEPWKDKVCIVPRFVGDRDDDQFVRLDTFFASRKIHLIKMDIEGWEMPALRGAENLLKREEIIWAVCSYHNKDDEQKIVDIYEKNGMEHKISTGLVYIKNAENMHCLRHALIWGKHGNSFGV